MQMGKFGIKIDHGNNYMFILKRYITLVCCFSLLLVACGKTAENNLNSDSINTDIVENNTSTNRENEKMFPDETEVKDTPNSNIVNLDTFIDEDPQELITFTQDELNSSEEYDLEEDYDSLIYEGMSDDSLRQSIQDSIYSELDNIFDESEVIIEDVKSLYASKEYLEEVAYNSKTNLFFGYSLEALEKQFGEKKYIFTLGKNGETVVEEFAEHKSIYDKVIKNTLIGTGVILVCVSLATVSTIASAPLGVSRIQVILSFSAAGSIIGGTVVGTASAVAAGVSEYIKNGDPQAAFDSALLSGSEGFKWGAIGGAVVGTAVGTYMTGTIHTWRESELLVQKLFPGSAEQVAFKDGVRLTTKVPGSTVPDLFTTLKDGTKVAIEVKNYDLNNIGVSNLIKTLRKQLANRVANMPAGTVQRLVLDVTGRGYQKGYIKFVVHMIQNSLKDICPDLIISVIGF